MVSRFVFIRVTLTVLLILAVSSPLVFAQSAPSSSFPISPSELHAMMAQKKAEALRRARAAAAAVTSVASTQTNYDVSFYDVSIRVDDTAEVLYGHVGFVASATQDGVTAVEVDLQSNMTVDSIVAPTGPLASSRAGDVVTVTLDATYNTGEQFEFVFYYHGHPVEGGFQAFSFGWHNGKRSISSLSEPYFARTWWPCKDRMDDKADSFYIAIEVDTSFYVGSNGTLDSVVQGGANSHVFHYTERYPMASYLFSVAIHPFTVWTDQYVTSDLLDTMPLVHAVYPDQYTTSLSGWGIVPNAIRIFAGAYGEYPFLNEKYGHSNFEWGGGMEHQTMTSMWGGWFGFYEPTVVHELSHQWWGDMITCKTWGDIWLNEGWASYSEAEYFLEKDGWASYHSYMNGMRYTGGGTIYVYDTTSVGNIFHGGRSYDKGAWVLHMLRGALGDSLFFEGVHAYYNSQYKYGAATTEDFKNVFEAATGQDLDWFFNEWIYGEYYPIYQYQFVSKWRSFAVYDNYIWVKQVQTTNPQVFTMPVDFWLDYSAAPDDTVTYLVDEKEKVFKFTTTNQLINLKLDPANWILQTSSLQAWGLHIVTLPSELSSGNQYLPYADTITAIGGTGSNTVTIVAGALPSGLTIDNNGVISGTTSDTGSFVFTVNFDDDGSSLFDEKEFTVYFAPTTLVPGDVDFQDGIVDISDLTYLIAYLFIQGPPPPVMIIADVNNDCLVDIGDITVLIGYLFNSGPAPVLGCAP